MADDDLQQLANSLGYSWPKDKKGQWRVMQLMAKTAQHWRTEVEKYQTETSRQVEKEKLYVHLRKRLLAMTRKVHNLRKALRSYMAFQTAFVREARAEVEADQSVLRDLIDVAKLVNSLDWCAGYELKEQDHTKLDDARLLAIDVLQALGKKANE